MSPKSFYHYFSPLAIAMFSQSLIFSISLSDIQAQPEQKNKTPIQTTGGKTQRVFQPVGDPEPTTTIGGGGRGLFQPVGDPEPTTTLGGGRRGDGKCPKDRTQPTNGLSKESLEQQLSPLLPIKKFGLTYSANPRLYAYIPKTSAIAVVFTLESKGEGIEQKRVDLTNSPSIVSIKFDTPLAIGQDYKWLVSVVCEFPDPEDNFSEGIVHRIKPSPDMIGKLAKAKESDRVDLYAKSGIWYEALDSLVKLRFASPNDPELRAIWQNLLKSSGLESLTTAPIKNAP